jgi:hypothetical protein
MLRHVALIRTLASEECVFSNIRVTRISELRILTVRNNTKWTFLRSVRRLLVTANIPSSLNHVTLMMEAIRSPETSILTWMTMRNIPEDGILHSHCSEDLKSYSVHSVTDRQTWFLWSHSLCQMRRGDSPCPQLTVTRLARQLHALQLTFSP